MLNEPTMCCHAYALCSVDSRHGDMTEIGDADLTEPAAALG